MHRDSTKVDMPKEPLPPLYKFITDLSPTSSIGAHSSEAALALRASGRAFGSAETANNCSRKLEKLIISQYNGNMPVFEFIRERSTFQGWKREGRLLVVKNRAGQRRGQRLGEWKEPNQAISGIGGLPSVCKVAKLISLSLRACRALLCLR